MLIYLKYTLLIPLVALHINENLGAIRPAPIMLVECDPRYKGTRIRMTRLVRAILPPIGDTGRKKGLSGLVGILGVSADYTGSAYLAAKTALTVGADSVSMYSTKAANENVQTYGPDVIVYPYLEYEKYSNWKLFRRAFKKIMQEEMDVMIVGPGLRHKNTPPIRINGTIVSPRNPNAEKQKRLREVLINIVTYAKVVRQPLILCSEAIDLLIDDFQMLIEYPPPGVIVVANSYEIHKLKTSLQNRNRLLGFKSFGPHVSFMIKGSTDYFLSTNDRFRWGRNESGTQRRVAGQGDFLVGALAVFWTWALRSNVCGDMTTQLFTATFAAHQLTRICNEGAAVKYGRAFTAFDMLDPVKCLMSTYYQREEWMGEDPFYINYYTNYTNTRNFTRKGKKKRTKNTRRGWY